MGIEFSTITESVTDRLKQIASSIAASLAPALSKAAAGLSVYLSADGTLATSVTGVDTEPSVSILISPKQQPQSKTAAELRSLRGRHFARKVVRAGHLGIGSRSDRDGGRIAANHAQGNGNVSQIGLRPLGAAHNKRKIAFSRVKPSVEVLPASSLLENIIAAVPQVVSDIQTAVADEL
jgi:hypothetical protein